MKVSKENIKLWLETLNTYNSTPENGTTRILFTDAEIAGREYVKGLMRDAGLSVREDAAGNIFGALYGSDPALAPVWSGSHIDTVYNAGMFDGMIGVIGAIEAARVIKESGLPHRRNIEAIVYTSEEPTRFGLGCLGSRALAGELTYDGALQLFDGEGQSLVEVLSQRGFDVNSFSKVAKQTGDVYAAVELHAEQGIVLSNKGYPLGIVTTIAAPTNIEAVIKGTQQHAGSTPMDMRSDAFLAACEIALELERLAGEFCANCHTTATVGRIEVLPNASNVISGDVNFSIDIRSSDFDTKTQLITRLNAFIQEVEANRKVTVSAQVINNDHPTDSDKNIIELLEDICKQKEIAALPMVSGAFHDSMMIGRFAPIAMLFVPSRDGISHSPLEFCDYGDIENGVNILAEALLTLAG